MRNNKTSSQSLQILFTKSVTRLQAGDIIHAKKGFIQLTRKLPDSAVVWYNLGLCHQHLGQHDKAITAYLKSLRIKPNQIDGWVNIGISYLELNQMEKAEEAILKSLELNPSHARGLNTLGTIQARQEKLDDARTSFNKSIASQPDNADAKINLANLEMKQGLIYSSLGDKSAELFYRKSISLDPLHGEAYRHLTAMKRFQSIDDPDAQQIISIWKHTALDNSTRISTAFALGKIYDDCGRYDDAFKVYKVGNNLKFKESRMNLEAWFDHIDRIPKVLNSPPQITAKPAGLTPQPIFILGMPRSGTTLVEQIVTRHSRVYGCGELTCIERTINRMEKGCGRAHSLRVYPDDFRLVNRAELETGVREYLSCAKQLHDIKSDYLTDKNPFNFLHIWLIKAMFPDSAIVHCQRHPLDVIISNYFQLFGSDVSFVYDLESLSRYYIRYHRLMIEWKDIFGDQIYNVVYEDLVSDIENQTRQLIGAVNLSWEDNCLDQNRSDTAVGTASIWQVRQGIYTRSRERWKNYQTHLQQCIAILVQAGILDSAGNWLERS